MPVRIIAETERYPLEHEGSTFYFRRVPVHLQRQYIEECTERGLTNWEQVGEKKLGYALLGWDNVLGHDGESIPYSPALVMALPESVLLALANKLQAADPLADALKN